MKILHLEDNPRDADLAHHQVHEEWPDCQVKVVDTRDAFLAQLGGEYDLIISDFSLAHFNGIEALHLARERIPEVPFIFLSGTIGEDRALEALRGGATDYVIKDRPKRLIPAIRRALSDARLHRERRATEEQLQRVQRLENIGMLAAGIAHDFNNVLTPVLMGIPLLRARAAGDSDQRILNSIETSVQRGAGLVRQILGFAHGMTGEPQLVQPKHLIRELVGIMEHTFPKTICIRDESETDLWPVNANPTQFHQVLLNLCVNARDAMPEGGVLRLRAVNRHLDELGAAAIPGARPGPYLFVEVTDTGTGIPATVLGRIWDPFFTTKDAGRGTGLGLSMVRGIVEGNRGFVAVQTRPGHGTTFQILLPASPESEAETGTSGVAMVPRGQGELILVVDDDAGVRDLSRATLTGHGYRVVAATDGIEALALFAPRSLEFRAVVADHDISNLDGSALTKVFRALNPTIQILTIGGPAGADGLRRELPGGGACLGKPFTSELLLGTIHRLLARAAPGLQAPVAGRPALVHDRAH